MTRLSCGLLLTSLACVAKTWQFTTEDSQEVVLLQVESRSVLNKPGGGSDIRFRSSLSKDKGFLQNFPQGLLSHVSFFWRGSVGDPNDDFAFVCALIITIIFFLACSICMLYETDSGEYDSDARTHHTWKENPARRPIVRQSGRDRTPSQQASPQIQGHAPAPPKLQSLGQSNMQVPVVSALSSVQDPSGVVTQVSGGSPLTSVSLPGQQITTNASVGSEHDVVESAIVHKVEPLCSALVLNVNARFRVAFDHLDRASGGPVPILGESSSKALLLAHLDLGANRKGGSVSLSLTEDQTLLGAIKSTGNGLMRITDMRGDVFGDFTYFGNLQYRMIKGGKEVAVLKYEPAAAATGRVHLTTPSGEQLAQASRLQLDGGKGGQSVAYLEVKVHPGVDSVLVLLCILGTMILG